MTVSRFFIFASVVVFALAAFGIAGPVALVPVGLALFAAAHFVGG